VFDAPRDVVFKAWTDSAPSNDWSAPRVFTVAAFEADLRPGGAWRLCMRTPEGKELWVGGVYREGWSECFDRLEEQLAGVDSANPRSTYR
jgi:uncharacterized protein YndB with AHSA1/START domain